jgi:hypothetical protein
MFAVHDLSKRYPLTMTQVTPPFVSNSDAIPGQVEGKDLDLFLQKGFKAFIWDDQFYVMVSCICSFSWK